MTPASNHDGYQPAILRSIREIAGSRKARNRVVLS
jgi:hypothetical protein